MKEEDARAILEDPRLYARIITEELDKTIVGEYKTRKAVFLALCAIWSKGAQINILVNSESSAGKSWVAKRIYDLFPLPKVEYTTKPSKEIFAYWHNKEEEPEWTWNGKICYIEDARREVLDSETFKVMCSEGSKAHVVVRGKPKTITIVGKPCFLLTTDQGNIQEALLNRFNLVNLDETEKQTKKIFEFHATIKKKGGRVPYDKDLLGALEHLKEVKVRIEFAEDLVKHFPSNQLRYRRDFARFLELISASAAYHQHQREFDENKFLLAEKQDYENAQEIINAFDSMMWLGLTKREKRAYDSCLKYWELHEPERFTVKQIHSYAPFISEQSWYKMVDKLLAKNVLSCVLEKREDSNRQVMCLEPGSATHIKLPGFEELPYDPPENLREKRLKDFAETRETKEITEKEEQKTLEEE